MNVEAPVDGPLQNVAPASFSLLMLKNQCLGWYLNLYFRHSHIQLHSILEWPFFFFLILGKTIFLPVPGWFQPEQDQHHVSHKTSGWRSNSWCPQKNRNIFFGNQSSFLGMQLQDTLMISYAVFFQLLKIKTACFYIFLSIYYQVLLIHFSIVMWNTKCIILIFQTRNRILKVIVYITQEMSKLRFN